MIDLTTKEIPSGQQLVAKNKWPIIGEKRPAKIDRPWQLEIKGLVGNALCVSPEDLSSMNQTRMRIDIHCVTRWSRQAVEFEGVLLSELLAQANVNTDARFISFISRSERNHSTSLPVDVAIDLNTLIALRVDDKNLELEHGGPIRNIVPGRYFYKSVKWLEHIELLAEDRLGFWEAETGYHNNADPWKEERYMAPTIDRRTAIKLIESRDFSDRDLRSIDASKRDLAGLNAKKALLRDADFRNSNLSNADFSEANLSNAHLENSDLTGVKFVGTDLEGANLSGADIRGADFTGCSLIGSSFVETQSDGTLLRAKMNQSTIIPANLLEPLTALQKEFFASHRS